MVTSRIHMDERQLDMRLLTSRTPWPKPKQSVSWFLSLLTRLLNGMRPSCNFPAATSRRSTRRLTSRVEFSLRAVGTIQPGVRVVGVGAETSTVGRLRELDISANARKKGIIVNLSEVVLFVGLGAIVGFAGGLFAIGGALIAIPLLTAAFGFTQHDSQGTAMVMALASASVTLVIYARKKLLRIRDDLVMAACSIALGLVSSQMVRYINDRALQRGFGAFLIVLAVFVWF